MTSEAFCVWTGWSRSTSRTRRRGRATCELKSGDLVRVNKSVVMYHIPKMRGAGLETKGLCGKVNAVILEKNGVQLSLNRPVQVKFDEPRFTGYYEERELELVQEHVVEGEGEHAVEEKEKEGKE